MSMINEFPSDLTSCQMKRHSVFLVRHFSEVKAILQNGAVGHVVYKGEGKTEMALAPKSCRIARPGVPILGRLGSRGGERMDRITPCSPS